MVLLHKRRGLLAVVFLLVPLRYAQPSGCDWVRQIIKCPSSWLSMPRAAMCSASCSEQLVDQAGSGTSHHVCTQLLGTMHLCTIYGGGGW
jgi:hypothetical protein